MLISLILSLFLFETEGGFGLIYFVSLLSSSTYKYCGPTQENDCDLGSGGIGGSQTVRCL